MTIKRKLLLSLLDRYAPLFLWASAAFVFGMITVLWQTEIELKDGIGNLLGALAGSIFAVAGSFALWTHQESKKQKSLADPYAYQIGIVARSAYQIKAITEDGSPVRADDSKTINMWATSALRDVDDAIAQIAQWDQMSHSLQLEVFKAITRAKGISSNIRDRIEEIRERTEEINYLAMSEEDVEVFSKRMFSGTRPIKSICNDVRKFHGYLCDALDDISRDWRSRFKENMTTDALFEEVERLRSRTNKTH